MADVHFRWEGNGMARMKLALDKLEGPRKTAAMRRAPNHTGDKAYTIVKRTLSKQMGLTQTDLEKRGLRRIRANDGILEYLIVGRGKFIALKDFAVRQGARGVSAAPWGVRRMFKSTFTVARYGGNFFKRLGKSRLAMEKLWGPSLPREIMRDATASAFQSTVAVALPARIEHEVRVLTDGVVS